MGQDRPGGRHQAAAESELIQSQHSIRLHCIPKRGKLISVYAQGKSRGFNVNKNSN